MKKSHYQKTVLRNIRVCWNIRWNNCRNRWFSSRLLQLKLQPRKAFQIKINDTCRLQLCIFLHSGYKMMNHWQPHLFSLFLSFCTHVKDSRANCCLTSSIDLLKLVASVLAGRAHYIDTVAFGEVRRFITSETNKHSFRKTAEASCYFFFHSFWTSVPGSSHLCLAPADPRKTRKSR